MKHLTRTYQPEAKDFRRCSDCNRECFPWPHRHNTICPICYDEKYTANERQALTMLEAFCRSIEERSLPS